MADAWLKGPIEGVPAALQPVAHALLNLEIELRPLLAGATDDELWQRPAGVAATGFHVRHLCGSADRLLTYARGEALTESQLAVLADEKDPAMRPSGAELDALLTRTLERALAQLRATDEGTLDSPRAVGRKGLPSTVRGLLFHAAEHGARHAGQAITTMKIVRGIG
jgi:uncharacterized damage-inducible protein DinB